MIDRSSPQFLAHENPKYAHKIKNTQKGSNNPKASIHNVVSAGKADFPKYAAFLCLVAVLSSQSNFGKMYIRYLFW